MTKPVTATHSSGLRAADTYLLALQLSTLHTVLHT